MYRSIKQNIKWLYLSVFFSGLYFDRALWVLYLGERGMNMSQVGFLEAILHLAIVFFEVPTGMIADIYGRKVSLVLGQLISLLYAVFMLISGQFFIFTLAFAFLGFSSTFKSGADQALLYDSLKKIKREKDYTKILGNQTAIILISFSLAKLIGGFMAEINWDIVYISIFSFQLIGLLPILMLIEPTSNKDKSYKKCNDKQKKKIHKKYIPFSAFKKQFIESAEVWKKQPKLHIPIALYVMLISVITVIIFYAQEHFARQGFSESQIGIIFTIESILGVFAAKVAYRIENRWESIKIFRTIYSIFILIVIVFAFSRNLLAVISLFILGMLSEFIEPIFSNFVHSKIVSKVRATFFSMISLLNSLLVVIMFPLFGFIVDLIGFQYSFLLLTIPMLLLIVFKDNFVKFYSKV